jgi:peptide/nickel transport system substrate-binding protein
MLVALLLVMAVACGAAEKPAPTTAPAAAKAPAAATAPAAAKAPAAVPTAIPAPTSGTLMLRAPEPNPKRGGTLNWAGLADAPFFDLHQCDTAACAAPMETMYDNLLRLSPLDGGKEIIPDLAYKWEMSKDGLTYTFHLREGVKFHDGALLTSEDVKASFDRIISPPVGILSPRKGVLDAVTEVKAVDPLTVQFVLKAPRGFLPDAISSGWMVVYRKKTLEDNAFDLRKVKVAPGTGPFIFESYQPGTLWKLKRNPNYWNSELPYLDGINFNHLAYGPATGAALLAGQVDYVYGAGGDFLNEGLKNPDKMTVVAYGIPSVLGGFINHEHKPLNDPRVRKAMNLVLDRGFIKKSTAAIREIDEGMWMPAIGTLAPAYREATLNKKFGYYSPTRLEDIAEAKRLLAAAGFPDGKGFPKVDIMMRNLNFLVAWGPLLQGMLKQHLNIESTTRVVETAVWVEDQSKGNYDIGINGNPATLSHPADYWQKWFGTGTSNWNKGASNPELDALLEKMVAENDPQKLAALVQQGTKILDEWVPSLIFGHATIIDGFRNYVKGHGRKNRVTLFDDNRFDTVWLDK